MPTTSKHSPCVGIRTCSDYSPFGAELDGFPAYELFVTDKTNGKNESNLIFNQNPIEAKETIYSLFGSGEHEYDYSGDSKKEQTGTKKAAVVGFKSVKNTPEE
jgi:hypothetical protein